MIKDLKKVWSLNKNSLIDFFSNYKTIYEFVDFKELIPMRDIQLVTSEHKIYLGQVAEKQKHGTGKYVLIKE
jgi:hypothetical protein